MKRTLSKIICLNLALILLLSFAVTALAAETEEAEELIDAPDWALAEDTYSALRAEVEASLPQPEQAADAPLLTSPEALGVEKTYTIRVGDISFESDQVKSGTGWEYADGELTLNGYSGGPIAASGDLMVYSTGNVTIQGATSDENSYGYAGISTLGALILYVDNGTFTVTGGAGLYSGGQALRSDAAIYLNLYNDATVTLTGGNASAGLAGHGIEAAEVHASGPRALDAPRLKVTGGSGALSATGGAVGGCGIWATSASGQTSLSVDAEIRGGNGGRGGAPALLYESACEIYYANITFFSGQNADGTYVSPIMFAKTAERLKLYKHMSVTMDDVHSSYIKVTINKYLLELRGGDDGWYGGATFTDLRDYYPTSYRIGDFTYKRAGYSLVSWTNRAKDRIVYLDRMYTPDEDTTLWADWVPTAAGDILLNGMGGRVEQDDSDFWRRYSGTSVTLPEHLWFQGYDSWVDRSVFGWHTSPVLTTDENGIMTGTWFAGGSEIKPDSAKTTELFAFCDPYGQAIVYHTTEGTRFGGDLFVQRVSSSDLKAYVLGGEDDMEAPEDCRFLGWAETPDGEVKYAEGDKVKADYGDPTHLYAVWKHIGGTYSLPEKCDALVDPKSETITLKPKEEWTESLDNPKQLFGAIYDPSGRMIGFGVFSSTDDMLAFGFDGKHLPLVKIFGLNDDDAPAGKNIEMDLENMEPVPGGDGIHPLK